MTTQSPGVRDRLPTFAMISGELCALTILAPMEYQTGRYIGVPAATAWAVTGVVYAVTILAIATSRLIPAAFGLVWLSGVVGALHSAGQEAKLAHEALDRARAGTSIAVVTIVVLAMAAAWWLARAWHEYVADLAQAADLERLEDERRRQSRQDELAARARDERELAAAVDAARLAATRAHELERARLEEERTRAARYAEQEAARLAHEHELRMAELARTRPARDPERAPRTGERAPKRAPVRAASVQADDLAERRQARDRVRDQWAAREAAGRATPARALARTLGIGEGAARAQVSRWKAERAGAPEAAEQGRTEAAR